MQFRNIAIIAPETPLMAKRTKEQCKQEPAKAHLAGQEQPYPKPPSPTPSRPPRQPEHPPPALQLENASAKGENTTPPAPGDKQEAASQHTLPPPCHDQSASEEDISAEEEALMLLALEEYESRAKRFKH